MHTNFRSAFMSLHVSKLFWIRLNRVLAWGMLASPLVQLWLGVRFFEGLMFDLALLGAHGVLSLFLFGTPKTKARVFNFPMHVLGFRPSALSVRNNFLLSGYRIALATGACVAMFIVPDGAIFALVIVFAYPLMRMPVTVAQHIFGGFQAAMRRTGSRDPDELAACAVVFIYMLASTIHFFKW